MLYYIEVIDTEDNGVRYYEDLLNEKSIIKRIKEQLGRENVIIKIGISEDE